MEPTGQVAFSYVAFHQKTPSYSPHICPSVSPVQHQHNMKHSISVLSWNIDMDTLPIAPRVHALLQIIRQKKPDVVLLQEVTAKSLPRIRSLQRTNPVCAESDEDKSQPEVKDKSPNYDLIIDPSWEEELPYFSVALLKQNCFKQDTEKYITHLFPTSQMGRGYISLLFETRSSLKIVVTTSHLESLQQGTTRRKDQFTEILDMHRSKVLEGFVTIFAGDTNLREKEISAKDVYKTKAAEEKRRVATEPSKKKSKVERKFIDAWLAAGADPEQQYTWDTRKNDNLQIEAEFRPYSRYDRAFLMAPEQLEMEVTQFQLLGKERLSCGKFISDHWGLYFELECSD